MATKKPYSVPESENREYDDLLVEAVRGCMSPRAVAAVAAWLQPARTKDQDVNRQIDWLREKLIDMLGVKEFNDLCDELGL